MSSFNRSNPFLYTLDAMNQKLVTIIQSSIKDWILQGVIGGLVILTSIIYWGLSKSPQYISSITCIGLFIFVIVEIRGAVRESDTLQIDIMKYGGGNGKSVMGYSYLNNEELFSKVTEISIQYGKVIYIRESIYIFDMIECIFLIIHVLQILIWIFK